MKRPDTALWDKQYKENMKEWCKYNIRESGVDNLKDFMRSFMQSERGCMSPVTIQKAWDEIQK